jgi:hypothetical protein
MCKRCSELDTRIGRYRYLTSCLGDKRALDALSALISEHEAEKKSLHPAPK